MNPGDTVQCVTAGPARGDTELLPGHEYTVESVNRLGQVKVEGIDGVWFPGRFRVVGVPDVRVVKDHDGVLGEHRWFVQYVTTPGVIDVACRNALCDARAEVQESYVIRLIEETRP